jgi:hypothetical protein
MVSTDWKHWSLLTSASTTSGQSKRWCSSLFFLLEYTTLSVIYFRIVDDRVFDNLKWLVTLKLNDNNICKIASQAFKVIYQIKIDIGVVGSQFTNDLYKRLKELG